MRHRRRPQGVSDVAKDFDIDDPTIQDPARVHFVLKNVYNFDVAELDLARSQPRYSRGVLIFMTQKYKIQLGPISRCDF